MQEKEVAFGLQTTAVCGACSGDAGQEKEDLSVPTMVTFFISLDSGCCHPASIPQGQGRNWLCAECQVCLGFHGTINKGLDQSLCKMTFMFGTVTNKYKAQRAQIPESAAERSGWVLDFYRMIRHYGVV